MISFKSSYSSQLQFFKTPNLSFARSIRFVTTYNSPRYSLMPLAGYLKKNFYDNSFMNIIDSDFVNYKKKYILSNKATIVMDGKKLSQNKKNKKILEIIYK